jgi:predicted hotdog family 3-hydroxylacyl-ACP dehydratase
MVVRVGVKVEVRVSGFAAELMAQGTIGLTVNVNIKEGKMAVRLGLILK